MNEENILRTWQENQNLVAEHNHEEITNDIKTKNMNKIKNTFERIKSKTQQLSVIMLLLFVGTLTITDVKNRIKNPRCEQRRNSP